MSFVLSMFDINGIQKYVFQSNRLQEIVGASTLVEQSLSEFLLDSIREQIPQGQYVVDWKQAADFSFLNDDRIRCEIIYVGGGNALVAFREKEDAKRVTRRFSLMLLEKAPSLTFTVVHEVVEGKNFNQDRKTVTAALLRKKSEMIPPAKMGGISITQLDDSTFHPITHHHPKYGFVTVENLRKREAFLQKKSVLPVDEFQIPLEFDDLGREEGESHIGIVHIDGNSFGRMLKDLLEGEKSYEHAVKKMRNIAAKIDEIYKKTFIEVVEVLKSNFRDGRIGTIQLKKKEEQYCLPIRDIVLDGDDVTFVCDGRLALYVSYMFLKKLSEKSLIEGNTVSACAGVVIAKSHFPFYRAYQIAEQCCQSAKKKAKEDGDPVGSWIDFHIVSSGITNDLYETRKKYYQIPTVSSIDYRKEYNLIWRPWLVNKEGVTDSDYDFRHFIRMHQSFTSGDEKWPRNKMKQLEEALMLGKVETEIFLKEAASKGLVLPTSPIRTVFDSYGRTPYYDVLEMLDFFIDLEEENREDENQDAASF
ncbi:hypothetical protein B9L19_11430 [Geobacillus thermocatenulatus]|uniref:Cas10/Cmr2 second palm domain-containing protein n=1 Tax=Geobacillus thermocatenulatus TaxID=33938 RepID=A0A226Q2Y8_9BACL|nr:MULTISPECIES: hypothetical protein [Geobacillus]ASS99763.1 hypothetical protein GT3921_12460 [Geobacillus thermocatenulatus]KLR72770.1 hypothetical protein ABH20_14670 [Geobacillus sp. T6]OXB86157.1 hypothetical protein B9L19_11430 [Geobacillus thermocatenulatus]